MKVSMKLSVSTVDASYGSGGEYDLPDILAKQWIKAGYAEALEDVSEESTPAAEASISEPKIDTIPAPVEPAPAVTSRRQRKPRAEAPKSDLL